MIDEIVVEEKGAIKKAAGLKGGKLKLFRYCDSSKANEGSIYLGKITKKIQTTNGKQAYFVNIGTEKEVFINAEERELEDLNAHEGQDIVVQIIQEQRAEKGARASRFLSFAGVNLVYRPYGSNIDISLKIVDEEKKEELYNILAENISDGGWIVRTHAAESEKNTIIEEAKKLQQQFRDIIATAKVSKAPVKLFEQNNVLEELLVQTDESLKKIVVNNHLLEEKLKPTLPVEYSTKPFEEYGIEEALQNALEKCVKLPSGGRIFIEETKAFVAIDVDSGEGTTQGNFGLLNQEAAKEIANQIMLRNLSGKIIVDFAGLTEFKFLKNILDVLRAELASDSVKTQVLGVSYAGNVEIIRQRKHPTLSDVFTEECASCQGTGRVEK